MYLEPKITLKTSSLSPCIQIKLNQVRPANKIHLNIHFSEYFSVFLQIYCANIYIFAEFDGKLIIIDKHAAHERMLFNKLKKENGKNGSQMLLSPISVTLSKEEYTAILENIDTVRESGFEIDDFGEGTVIVRACPLNLEKENIVSLITEIAGYLLKNQRDILPEKLDWIYHSIACRAAIKAGNDNSDYELMRFVKKLLTDKDVRYCPHGRPVIVEMTKYELDKQFGRIQ